MEGDTSSLGVLMVKEYPEPGNLRMSSDPKRGLPTRTGAIPSLFPPRRIERYRTIVHNLRTGGPGFSGLFQEALPEKIG